MAASEDTGVVAVSSIFLSDIYDVRPISAYIKSNKALSQLYNPADSTYTPDYKVSPIVLTSVVLDPVTHKENPAGLSSVIWSYQYKSDYGTITSTNSSDDWYVSGTKGENLNIKNNFGIDSDGATFTALISYTDSDKNTTATNSVSVKIDLRNLVKTSIILNTYSPTGYNIVNSMPSSISFNGDLYINGTIDSTTKRKNDWFRQDTSVLTTDNPLYDSRVGLGWAKILPSYTGAKPNFDYGSIVTTSARMQILPEDIINVESYRLITVATEGEHKNSPQHGFFTAYNFDSALTISIETPDGSVFKNGNGSKHLKGVVYNLVGEVDSNGTLYNYNWYVYKSDGTLDTTFGGSGKKSGKTILVDSSEIDDNSQLTLEVTDG